MQAVTNEADCSGNGELDKKLESGDMNKNKRHICMVLKE